jgi:hypothetical protein
VFTSGGKVLKVSDDGTIRVSEAGHAITHFYYQIMKLGSRLVEDE